MFYRNFFQGKFTIDTNNGVLKVADTLDREQTSAYNLIVEAWDNYQFGYTSGESRNAFKQIMWVYTHILHIGLSIVRFDRTILASDRYRHCILLKTMTHAFAQGDDFWHKRQRSAVRSPAHRVCCRHWVSRSRRYDLADKSYGRGRPEHGQRSRNVFNRGRQRARSVSTSHNNNNNNNNTIYCRHSRTRFGNVFSVYRPVQKGGFWGFKPSPPLLKKYNLCF